MRLLSQIFQPVISIPKNAKIKNTEITCKSQKLLLECGLVRPTSSGLFTILPLARRALNKLETLVIECLEAADAQRLSLPSLTASQLWDKSGRLGDVGAELMTVDDRHGKKYLLAPTHEEAIADLLADVGPLSYKQLPLLFYQISNKYRDEARPKHGLLRSRQFSMMDAYGAHASEACARNTYARLGEHYRGLFSRLRLPVHSVAAPPGDMGGCESHEWHLKSAAGEDAIRICPSCSHATLAQQSSDKCKCGSEMEDVSGIEVGHTFILGTRYSEPLGANYVPASGAPRPLVMSCYGIGITRLMAASIEVLSSDTSIRWPLAIAPYNVMIIGPKEGSKEWQSHGDDGIRQVYELVSREHPGDVLVDDRHHLTVGKRMMMADKMGYPIIVVCGKTVMENPPRYEVYKTVPHANSKSELVTYDQLQDAVRIDDETEKRIVDEI